MKFKIKNTEINVSFTFFAVFLILLCIGELKICLFSLVASLIHELIHIVFIIVFSCEISKMTLSAFGADIKRNSDILTSNYKEAIISFSAPVFNIIIGLVSYLIFKKPTVFGTVNLIIGIFNLLPYFSFDGGRGLSFVLKSFFEEKTVEIILNIFSATVTILFSFISVYIFFHHKRNITLIFLSFYMIANLLVSVLCKNKKVNKCYKS